MQAIRNWLLQPYPFERRWSATLRAALLVGLFVTFFLFFFKPFGTQISPGAEGRYLIVCSYFGLVTIMVTLLVHIFCLLLPKVFEEEYWKIWKEILFNLSFIGCIGFGNLLLAHLLWDIALNGRSFWGWQLLTFAVGIFPILFGVFWGQLKLTRKFAAEAATLHGPKRTGSKQDPFSIPDKQDELLIFSGDNQDETLPLQAAQVIFLAARDNYVQVYFYEKGALQSRMLRTTLRKMEDVVKDRAEFFRCHRTYLVNFSKLEKVSGNAQGYRLQLAGIEERIPVSRNLNDKVRGLLNQISSY